MHVRDIRGSDSIYSLDTNGFEVRTIAKTEWDMMNEEIVRMEYFEEISSLIKRA